MRATSTATQTAPSAVTPEPRQQDLPGFAELRADTGLTELPSGAGELKAKELKFVAELLRDGCQRRAAIAAGYSEQSADQIASELLRRPRVAGFYRRSLERLGADTNAAIRRLEERARIFAAKAIVAAQETEAAKAIVAAAGAKLAAKPQDKDLMETFEMRVGILRRHQNEEAHYSRLAGEADKTLLSAAGKLSLGVNVSGRVDVEHRQAQEIPQEVLPFLTGVRISPSNGERKGSNNNTGSPACDEQAGFTLEGRAA
jgi:phage terminase small subunit